MPRRADIETILVIGSGPIVIGQACEFDYSGTQGCKALREEGYRVVLVNSNPATIMTDPEQADATYIEPMTVSSLEAVIERERPDALLPTLGGQTALNLSLELHEAGVLERWEVELIGASVEAIDKAEDRQLFRAAMEKLGLRVPASGYVGSIDEARRLLPEVGLPAIVRPSFTLGGSGAGVAHDEAEFVRTVAWGLQQSPRHTCLVEESVLGWKEFELEVMRDRADNVVIVCSIENLDPMGVHTGDSITVAPAQTLTDKEYQVMRDAAVAIIREIGVDTGGSNIQFAVDPRDGTLVVIEMNPRVSRSSALASKATGFPIAKIAAKLAVGYTLDEIPNDITRETPASFEPTIDYVVTKIPRFTFEKFPGVDDELTTQMKSVGEAMGIGRTFKESLHKAIRSLEIDRYGLERPGERAGQPARRLQAVPEGSGDAGGELERLWQRIEVPRPDRLWALAEAFRHGATVEDLHARSRIDPWFLGQIAEIVDAEAELLAAAVPPGRDADGAGRGNGTGAGTAEEGTVDERDGLRRRLLRPAKRMGFSDRRLAQLWGMTQTEVRELRHELELRPVYKRVDTCGAEFVAHTPYLYSTYERECEADVSDRRKVVILGGGPNRIGQGLEFDYCCVHAVFALREAGFETIMVNCNPETVSTDYDTSDRLYFEPLTLEDVLEIVHLERPEGVIVQFGGQTPLRLAVPLERNGVRILGTPPDAIDRAEDRERFDALLEELDLERPPSGVARSLEEAEAVAERLGYPVLVRPSYVLGGRAMQIVNDAAALRDYVRHAVEASPEHPVLVDRFLADAIEVDVDAVSDGERVVIGGIMEHIEEAGVHSGDSACSLPPWSLAGPVLEEIVEATRRLALELGVSGLMNVQFAVKEGRVFVLEVNPRASRTVPFVSKATGVQLAKLAARVMLGESLEELGFEEEVWPRHFSVKAPVFPFVKFPGVDPLLGPEMKSTGEVMGIDTSFSRAYGKAQIEVGTSLPQAGTIVVSVRQSDHRKIGEPVRKLHERGFKVMATVGTATVLMEEFGVPSEILPKVGEGRPDIVDRIERGDADLVINTVEPEPKAVRDSASIRRAAVLRGLPYFTTIAGARAAIGAILAGLDERDVGAAVRSLQEIHTEMAKAGSSGQDSLSAARDARA